MAHSAIVVRKTAFFSRTPSWSAIDGHKDDTDRRMEGLFLVHRDASCGNRSTSIRVPWGAHNQKSISGMNHGAPTRRDAGSSIPGRHGAKTVRYFRWSTNNGFRIRIISSDRSLTMRDLRRECNRFEKRGLDHWVRHHFWAYA